MKLARKYLPQIAGALLVFSTVALLTPRTMHALAAALVQVTNTLANPAITQDSSRAASQIVLLHTPFGSQVPGGQEVAMVQVIPTQGDAPTAYVVPSGQNLVLTGVDFDVNTASPNTFVDLRHSLSNNGLFADEIFSLPNAGHQEFRFPSGIVIPAGSSVHIDNGNAGASTLQAVVQGYLTAN